ncbi:transposase, IS605 OrfB family, central region [Epilithonimonas zeae]|uniref:Transposase, IS605 OrfB family, central region n=2 Tax=Epilithonimonas zeae TaxID=1416779 RepID=A0A1N6EVE3_9FLAO|nr:transposase, IS605 OrfB family, central region [Epilithonimonas zeae]
MPINFCRIGKTLKYLFDMEKSTITLTRKIQLLIDVPSDQKKEVWEKLYQYQNRCFRAANLIVSHLYVQEMIKDFFYLTEEIQYKLADEKKDQTGMFNRSKTGTTARMVFDRFKGEIPTDILGSLNNTIQSTFSKNKAEYWKGLKSLRNFRKDIPIPLPIKCISKLRYDPDKKAFCFNMFAIPVKTYLGKDYTDKRLIMERLLKDEIKLCTSQIQLKDRKIFWLAVFEFEKEENHLKPEIIAEASLSLEHPIVVKVNNIRMNIGSKEEFLYRRLAIQASQKRIQDGIAYARSANGAKRKQKALYKTENLESRYVSNRLHVYSRQLIDFCIRQQAGTLVLKNQEDKIGIAKEQEFVLRNWSYYELQNKIKYKAEKAGIELIIG